MFTAAAPLEAVDSIEEFSKQFLCSYQLTKIEQFMTKRRATATYKIPVR